MKNKIKLGCGTVVSIGDTISFKSDHEQYGKLTAINGDFVVIESVHDEGFTGDYIGGDYEYLTHAERCWSE